MSKHDDKEFSCSFCGKTNEEAGRLVAGPGVFICDECIEVCYNMMNQKHTHTAKAKKEAEEHKALVKQEEERLAKLEVEKEIA